MISDILICALPNLDLGVSPGSIIVMYGNEDLSGPSLSLTLLHTEDFSKKKAVMAKARSCSDILKRGCTYSCSESYGGNSLTCKSFSNGSSPDGKK